MIHDLPPQFSNRPIRIAVAGAGGTGSQVLSGLARMHLALRALGHEGLDVCAFDPDNVTEANVGRQLFSPSDLGANKAAVLVNRLNCFFNLDWNASPTRYKSGLPWSNHTVEVDFLIGCVDSAAARRELAATRFRYWLDIGNTAKKGQVILGTRLKPQGHNRYIRLMQPKVDAGNILNPDESIAVRKMIDAQAKLGSKSPFWEQPPRPRLVTEIFPELKNKRFKEDTAPSCSLAEALAHQDLFINQTVATFALQLLWQFIRHGGLDIHGYFINLETGKVTPLPIAAPVTAPPPQAPGSARAPRAAVGAPPTAPARPSRVSARPKARKGAKRK